MRALALLVLALLGCDESEILSELELEFQIRGQDADGDGTVVDQAPIDLGDDAPWRLFADRIASDFGGSPGDLKLHAVSMRLVDTSEGVQDLGDVFNGPVAFRLRTSSTQSEYNLAVADIRAANEATSLSDFIIEFDYQTIAESEREAIVAGQMSALFVGQASDEFRDSGAVAMLSARLEFGATAPADPTP